MRPETPAEVAPRLEGLTWREMIPILKQWQKATASEAHSKGYSEGCNDTQYGWEY